MLTLHRTGLVKYNGPCNGWRQIWLKDETAQISGAFKIRGVANYFRVHQPRRPVVAASTGNHGSAVAIVAHTYGLPAYIFVPRRTAEKKKNRLLDAGAHLIEIDGFYDDCEVQARRFARQHAYQFIHSFEEDAIIEGHRSLFHEIEQDRPGIRHFFVPVGGGGLLTAALRHYPERDVVGVEFDSAPSLLQSILENKRTRIKLAPNPVEGLSVSQIGAKVFAECLKRRPDVKLIDLGSISSALFTLWNYNKIKCEMAGVASLAAALGNPVADEECVCIISGGNIDEPLFQNILIGKMP